MSWTKPTLVYPLTRTGGAYANQLDQNLASIDAANAALESELASTVTPESIYNQAWLAEVLGEASIVGLSAFALTFSPDHKTVTVGAGLCVIGGRLHEKPSPSSHSIDGKVDPGQTKRLVVGAASAGAPGLSLIVDQVDDGDDEAAGIDLLVWDFDVTNITGTYVPWNLRRRQLVAPDLAGFDDAALAETPLRTLHKDNLPVASGYLEEAGLIAPWDCEVARAYGRLATAPGGGASTTITLRSGTTDATAGATFTDADAGVVKEMAGLAEPHQLPAGTWLRPYCSNSGDPSAATDLVVVAVLRRTFHAVEF